MSLNEGLSQHPVDRLIRELIRTERPATQDEIEQIVVRVSSAPFEPRLAHVPLKERDIAYQGYRLEARTPSLIYHLVKRVVLERQWAYGTTANQYLEDLRRAARARVARLAVYERRGGHLAITVIRTEIALPRLRRTRESLPELLVIYSADRGIIVSGYQVSSLDQTGVPRDVLWLK